MLLFKKQRLFAGDAGAWQQQIHHGFQTSDHSPQQLHAPLFCKVRFSSCNDNRLQQGVAAKCLIVREICVRGWDENDHPHMVKSLADRVLAATPASGNRPKPTVCLRITQKITIFAAQNSE
jgi:hypothetical protein